jgi:hypothetical protein
MFVHFGPSIEEEREISSYVQSGKLLGIEAFLDEVVSEGGSLKVSHSNNDGGVYLTLSADKVHQDYGGYNFGFAYPTLVGAMALAQWFWYTRLQTDVGMKYLPIKVQDWLVIP